MKCPVGGEKIEGRPEPCMVEMKHNHRWPWQHFQNQPQYLKDLHYNFIEYFFPKDRTVRNDKAKAALAYKAYFKQETDAKKAAMKQRKKHPEDSKAHNISMRDGKVGINDKEATSNELKRMGINTSN